METQLSLRGQRVLFTRCLAELIGWIGGHPTWEVALDEGKVFSQRHSRWHIPFEDGMHIAKSYHYSGLACDLLLYVGGEYIQDGNHPAWKEIGKKWESLHPLCTSGRRWNDSNHVSLGEGSKNTPLP